MIWFEWFGNFDDTTAASISAFEELLGLAECGVSREGQRIDREERPSHEHCINMGQGVWRILYNRAEAHTHQNDGHLSICIGLTA